MEEIKFRLNHNDATIMANVCERLYETIITKLEKKSEKNEELELLWHEGNLLKGIEKKSVKR